jgi:hypothetical protein
VARPDSNRVHQTGKRLENEALDSSSSLRGHSGGPIRPSERRPHRAAIRFPPTTLLSSHAGTSPTGDERHNKRKSGPARPTASKRVSSPPGRDHLLHVGRHRHEEGEQQASKQHSACGYFPLMTDSDERDDAPRPSCSTSSSSHVSPKRVSSSATGARTTTPDGRIPAGHADPRRVRAERVGYARGTGHGMRIFS